MRGVLAVALAATMSTASPLAAPEQESGLSAKQVELVKTILWGSDDQSSRAAAALRAARGAESPSSRAEFLHLEEILREGRPPAPQDEPVVEQAGPTPQVHVATFSVELPDGRNIPVFTALPPGYDPARPWPVIFAMHGGPPGSEEGAVRSAGRMIDVWLQPAADAGWIVVSPAMVHVRTRGRRTENRLPYEVLRPEQAAAIISAVQRRYRIDPDRIVSTGISLGSNFSIGYAAAIPDRFAAIVPVSTEGDSREHLLRNLQHVPTYVLEGTQDRNIRGITGPRALGDILARFSYDATYREFGDRAHEGFQELYPDVLRWLATRPRDVYPREVLRVPHRGIMPLSRRVFWIESDTRQGVVRARLAGDNHIEITARWAGAVTLYLHDRLVDLDRPVALTVNGVSVGERNARRSIEYAIEQARIYSDPGRAAADMITVPIPQTTAALDAGLQLWSSLEPLHPEGQLSFWEFYAVNALVERFPAVGLRGREVPLSSDLAAALVADGGSLVDESVGIELDAIDIDGPFAGAGLRAGDILLKVGGESFFRGRGGLEYLHHWLIRELTGTARAYDLVAWRADELLDLEVELSLGRYRQQ